MISIRFPATLLALACWPSLAAAQSTDTAVAPAGYAPITAPCTIAADGRCYAIGAANPLNTAGKQESLQLAAANVPAAAASVYGGHYVFTATCSTWVANGITLQQRGPDGATMLTAQQLSANGSVEVGVGSSAVVAVVVAAGSAGCNASLSREPQS